VTAFNSGLRSFSGGELRNGAPVRFAHVDEAGTSKNEQHCVVAGVVSHPDLQWLSINRALKDLTEEFVPPQQREGTIFHAKDIFHGSKRFTRELWPKQRRMELLGRMANLPVDHSLPVICGTVDKSDVKWDDVKQGSHKWQAWNYSLAFAVCVTHFEYVLRTLCGANELGTIIAEDTPEMRQYAKFGYKRLCDPNVAWEQKPGIVNYMPMERVVEQPLFSAKDESGILQLADFVAFIMARRLNGHDDVQWLLDRFASQVVILPHQRG
jgi:Protein of unknown function (DUF3800)